MTVKRYRIDYKHGVVEDDGSRVWPATTSVAMVPASDFDAVLKDRDALQGKLKVAVEALNRIAVLYDWKDAREALAQIGDL